MGRGKWGEGSGAREVGRGTWGEGRGARDVRRGRSGWFRLQSQHSEIHMEREKISSVDVGMEVDVGREVDVDREVEVGR